MSPYEIICDILFIFFLLILSVFDLKTGRIPLLFFIGGALVVGLVFIFSPMFDIKEGIYGLLAGGGIFLLLYLATKRETGEGDVAVAAFAGGVLGLHNIIFVIILSTLAFALTGVFLNVCLKKRKHMPFIPFVTLACAACLGGGFI